VAVSVNDMHTKGDTPTMDSLSYRLLDPEQYPALAGALGDTPETMSVRHMLDRRACRAYVAGDPSPLAAAVVQSTDFPAEPMGFGPDPQALWRLLQLAEGWTCISVDYPAAAGLGEIMAQARDVPVRYLDDVYHTLTRPVVRFRHPDVRLLTRADYDLLEAAEAEFRGSLWGSTRNLLEEGIIACGIVGGQVVATALVSGCSARYVDIGVYTHPAYRGQGMATAAASLVAEQVQGAGRVPVWSAGAHNTASLRVARKLGFAEVSRRQYVIPAH